MIKFKEGSVVVPGEAVAEGKEYRIGQGFYRVGENVFASRLGILRVKKEDNFIYLVPLTGVYNPREGDTVIGKIEDFHSLGWRIDLFCPYSAMLMVREVPGYVPSGELDKVFDIGDLACVKITKVTNNKMIDVSMNGPGLFKLNEGRIIKISSQKVPRVIGKQGSMVNMLKDKTGCKVIVGKNGLIWTKGDPKTEIIVNEAIQMIEDLSHTSGLTDRVSEMLDKRMEEYNKNKG